MISKVHQVLNLVIIIVQNLIEDYRRLYDVCRLLWLDQLLEMIMILLIYGLTCCRSLYAADNESNAPLKAIDQWPSCLKSAKIGAVINHHQLKDSVFICYDIWQYELLFYQWHHHSLWIPCLTKIVTVSNIIYHLNERIPLANIITLHREVEGF